MPVTITTAHHAPRTSFLEKELQGAHVSPSRNGLVYAAYYPYNHHHHLTIRPEDVWFAILSQLNFYINAHAEELRDYFVAHEGQKELTVYAVGTLQTVDVGGLAQHMTKLIQDNVKDPDLKAWIMPNFTTTTDNDRSVAAVLMIGAMQKYFSYGMSLMFGIPAVTLLGEREDYAKASPELQAFWGRIADKKFGGSGPTCFSGWITAFCVWDKDGKPIHRIQDNDNLESDGVKYGQIDIED